MGQTLSWIPLENSFVELEVDSTSASNRNRPGTSPGLFGYDYRSDHFTEGSGQATIGSGDYPVVVSTQNASALTTSPPALVERAHQVWRLMVFLMN